MSEQIYTCWDCYHHGVLEESRKEWCGYLAREITWTNELTPYQIKTNTGACAHFKLSEKRKVIEIILMFA